MQDSYDVVIVGGGVTGSATAYWLGVDDAFDGSVLVIERDPTYENAPSARATGGIRQQFSTPENIQIGLFGAHFARHADDYLSVDGDSAGVLFREQGYLLLGTAEAMPVLRENQAIQAREGASIVVLEADELAERFPWVVRDRLEGATFGTANEGWVDPYSMLQAFRRKARSLGAEYLHDEVVEVAHDGSRASGLRLASGRTVTAGTVLNAAGASGAAKLARQLGVELPVQSRLRTTYVWECRHDFRAAPLTVLPSGVAWRPEGERCIGSVTPPADADPERFDYDIDYAMFEEFIWPELAEWVPPFEALKLVSAWCCHYDFNTLDENAIIDRLPGYDNVLFACGFSGHGFQQAPAVGRALAELIVHGEYRVMDLGRFGYQRVLDGDGIHESNCW